MLRGYYKRNQSFRLTDRSNRPVARDKIKTINNAFYCDIVISDSCSRRSL